MTHVSQVHIGALPCVPVCEYIDCYTAGAGEDVEQAMLRLTSQATESALMRDRQAQLDKDYKVGTAPKQAQQCCIQFLAFEERLAQNTCQSLLVTQTRWLTRSVNALVMAAIYSQYVHEQYLK